MRARLFTIETRILKEFLIRVAGLGVFIFAMFQIISISYATSSGTCGDKLTWTLNNIGELVISGTGSMYNYYEEGPDYGYSSTKEMSPWGQSIKSVIVQPGVLSIGGGAFYKCTDLVSISLPETIVSIGIGAFNNCHSLTNITLPNNLLIIEEYAFYGCSRLTNILIPDNVVWIGSYAFAECIDLTDISLPSSLCWGDNYPSFVFYKCKNLSSVTLADGPTIIPRSAFCKCTSLTSISIPGSVTEIRKLAFQDCSSLTTVYISDSVTSIADDSFKNCPETLIISCDICSSYSYKWAKSHDIHTETQSHANIIVDPAEEATCAKTGLTEGSHCSDCGDVIIEQMLIPPFPHTTVTDPAVPSTCTRTGFTEGSHCSVCNTVLIAQEAVPMMAHTSVTDPAVAPTCTKTGLTKGSHCAVCNTVLVAQEEVAMIDHNYTVIEEIAATVGRSGSRMYECTLCGKRYKEAIPTLKEGHSLIGKTWKIFALYQGSTRINKADWGTYTGAKLVFNADNTCSYTVMNKSGLITSGTSSWSMSDHTVYIPQINSLYNFSSSSATATLNDGMLYMIMWTSGGSHQCYFTPNGEAILDDESEAYIGTWKSDHIYMPDKLLRIPCKYWPDIPTSTIVISDDNTISVDGQAGSWSVNGGSFYLDGERDALTLNDYGQLLLFIGDGMYLVYTKGDSGKLPTMTEFKLPKGLGSVGREAFEGINAQVLVVPSGCASIGIRAFADCPKLKLAVIPKSVSTIANSAFSGTDVTILTPSGSYAGAWAEEQGVNVIYQ